MWSFKKAFIGLLFCLSGCGFQPLYAGKTQQGALPGKELSANLAQVFVNEVNGVYGQILRSRLMDSMTPQGNTSQPKFRLSVELPEPTEEELGIQMDNIATRMTLFYTATYTLTSYPDGRRIMTDTANAMGSYNIVDSPYATEVAERALKKRLAEMLGADIALRVAVYLRNHPELSEGDGDKE